MCNNTLVRTRNIIDIDRINSDFSYCDDVNLKAIKSHFKGSYNKRNLTLVVMSYETYETRLKLVLYISYEMTTHVRFSM